jgi:hypothetical protein
MSEQVFSREFWRLGHRRPWWQWNVITLFVPLFLLVWIREFLRVPQGATWLLCVGVLTAWFLIPALALPIPWRDAADSGHQADDAASNGSRAGYLLAAIAMFLLVALAGGITAGACSIVAALLYAAAIRPVR